MLIHELLYMCLESAHLVAYPALLLRFAVSHESIIIVMHGLFFSKFYLQCRLAIVQVVEIIVLSKLIHYAEKKSSSLIAL